MAQCLRPDAEVIGRMRKRYQPSLFRLGCRLLARALPMAIAFGIITSGIISWRQQSDATAPGKEAQEVLQEADRLLAELSLMKIVEGQVLGALLSLEEGEQRQKVIKQVHQARPLILELESALPRVKMSGSGIGFVSEKMSRLRERFLNMCATAGISCPSALLPQQPEKKPKPGRKFHARRFSCRNAGLTYNFLCSGDRFSAV
ncbi:MAG: hypothetical protein HY474_02040 [Candidatus Sungbacteria bacterium]|uniref:Uncharacterized protein n=1 Tax=Candidatus Sungiibacteriota bacterium TaxID=2750080 RepID=A0A932YVY4_9BACT|nr:hypothetical protein [Candidatus Sungbacteria bacterium]